MGFDFLKKANFASSMITQIEMVASLNDYFCDMLESLIIEIFYFFFRTNFEFFSSLLFYKFPISCLL